MGLLEKSFFHEKNVPNGGQYSIKPAPDNLQIASPNWSDWDLLEILIAIFFVKADPPGDVQD